MILRPLSFSLPLTLLLAMTACQPAAAARDVALPAPAGKSLEAPVGEEQVAVFAGGCFWGIEAVFEHVKGVREAVSGYTGGSAGTAHYPAVSRGDTGHAEAVRVRFDPRQVSYATLLQVFFSVALDPTQLDRQGPDVGPQYRSLIFYGSAQQQTTARDYIAQLTDAKAFPAPIVTRVVPLQAFYPAESYHQNYLRLHPDEPYIVYNDAPKVAQLGHLFPALYRDDPQLAGVR